MECRVPMRMLHSTWCMEYAAQHLVYGVCCTAPGAQYMEYGEKCMEKDALGKVPARWGVASTVHDCAIFRSPPLALKISLRSRCPSP